MLKRLISAIFRRNEDLKAIVMESPISILVFRGPEFVVDFANQKVYNTLGTSQPLVGRPVFEVHPELVEQGLEALLKNVFKTGQTTIIKEMPIHLNHSNKESLVLNFTLQPFRNDKGIVTGIIAVGNDVTELVESRRRVEENEARYHGVIDLMDHGFTITEVICDENRKPVDLLFLEANPAFERLTGFKDIVNRRITEFFPDVEPFWIEFYASVALSGKNAINTQEVKELGKIFETNAFRIGGPGSMKVATLFTDVTEKVAKTKVLESFNEALNKEVLKRTMQLQKINAELIQYGHAMSHDLHEPVRKIQTFVSLLQASLGSNIRAEEQHYITRINSACKRLRDLIEGVYDYVYIENPNFEFFEVNLNPLLDKILDDLEVIIKKQETRINVSQLPPVRGIPQLLYQLFYNLIYNSLKFSKKEGTRIITISGKEFQNPKEEEEVPDVNLESNGTPITSDGDPVKSYIQITVKDNGIGFDPEHADKIFNTFVRLHSQDTYEGTGIGLAICKKIVERHGGTITASGQPNLGAEFIVTLPKID